jgi:hypothetical protein
MPRIWTQITVFLTTGSHEFPPGSISKCGDRRVRTLLYEAANVMLTRYTARCSAGRGCECLFRGRKSRSGYEAD